MPKETSQESVGQCLARNRSEKASYPDLGPALASKNGNEVADHLSNVPEVFVNIRTWQGDVQSSVGLALNG